MRFSYIIGYRYSEDRLRNLKFVLNWLKNFDCEVIIVESDVESKIEHLSGFDFKHIFTKNNYPYNRSWTYNVGWKYATTDKLVFGDADLIVMNDSLLQSVKLLDEYDCVNPYSSVQDLDEMETVRLLEKADLSILTQIDKPGRTGTNMCGGLVLFSREGFEKIGGWNEEFWGWGAEDDFMTIKVEFFLKYLNRDGKCYHMNHEKAAIDRNLYYRNLQILQAAKLTPKENFIGYMREVIKHIGQLQK